jgi:hypothetical protein
MRFVKHKPFLVLGTQSLLLFVGGAFSSCLAFVGFSRGQPEYGALCIILACYMFQAMWAVVILYNLDARQPPDEKQEAQK